MSNFKSIYRALYDTGTFVEPRGMKVLELENFGYTLDPYERFANFPSRKLSLDYIKAELRWYLKGDLRDLSICDRAKIWKDCVTDPGTGPRLHSNYGHYVFRRGGLKYMVEELTRDKDSRRAAIPIYDHTHMFETNRDVPCTMYMSFRIRDDKLNMSVRMRSQDAIFGLGNDAPFFSIVHEMLYVYLREVYPTLRLGTYHHLADSLHVYERHFGLLLDLLTEQVEPVECPMIEDANEVDDLLIGVYDYSRAFSKWLHEEEA